MRFHISGDLRTNDVTSGGELVDGLYVVEGDVHLNNVSTTDHPWRATIVARGKIQISGGINQLPVARGIFLFTEYQGNQDAIKLSGSSSHWAGLILAPYDDVDMSGSDNSDLGGMIMAQRISISGSSISINHRPEYCPPNPPRILLVQ